ncbi:MAG: hypothetical protein V9E81_04015 [Marmoricola sp.]
MRRVLTLITGAALAVSGSAVALSGCADKSATPEPTPSKSTSTAPTPSDTAKPTADPTGPAFVSGKSSGEGGELGATHVTNIRSATHSGFDRLVVDFDGPVPSWQADYATSFVYDGSGEPVPIKGNAGLQVTIQATGYDESSNPVYTGPQLQRPQFPTLRAWAVTGDFEGQFGIGLALNSTAPYRVFAVESPSRLIIDVKR